MKYIAWTKKTNLLSSKVALVTWVCKQRQVISLCNYSTLSLCNYSTLSLCNYSTSKPSSKYKNL